MPERPASVPDLCISSRSSFPREIEKFIIRQPPIGEKDDYDSENSFPKEGVSCLSSSSRASCKAMRVASEIRPLVLIQTSVDRVDG